MDQRDEARRKWGMNLGEGALIPSLFFDGMREVEKMRRDWIVTRSEPSARHECTRCGAVEEITVPVPISEFVKQAKAFIGRHKGCTSKAKTF